MLRKYLQARNEKHSLRKLTWKDGDIFKSQKTFAVCRKVNISKQGTISEQWRLQHLNLLIRICCTYS